MSQRRPIRAYADTSVFGGVFDEEFADDNSAFFARAARGEVLVLISAITEAELRLAPDRVQGVLSELPSAAIERADLAPEVDVLADEYLRAGVVGPRWLNDAMHVAAATIARADVLVSWNFKHIVRFDRVRGFNAVNYGLGYAQIAITSPAEVRYAGESEDL